MAIHPKLSKGRINFIVAENGLYFPSGEGSLLIPKNWGTRWLFIPWKNVFEISETVVTTTEGARTKGIALLVQVSQEERKDFLSAHAHLSEKLKKGLRKLKRV